MDIAYLKGELDKSSLTEMFQAKCRTRRQECVQLLGCSEATKKYCVYVSYTRVFRIKSFYTVALLQSWRTKSWNDLVRCYEIRAVLIGHRSGRCTPAGKLITLFQAAQTWKTENVLNVVVTKTSKPPVCSIF